VSTTTNLGHVPVVTNGVTVSAHYTIVDNPIMTGMMIEFWTTPLMSAPCLLVTVVNTTYIYINVKTFEEPHVVTDIGPSHGKYLTKKVSVPPLCPR
jgi:protein-S-isoprenylcysteine O-methyltransferase Ste14